MVVVEAATQPSHFAHFWPGALSSAPAKGERHLNVKKVFKPISFYTLWLGNLFRATRACTFWTSQLPKVLRLWCVFSILFRFYFESECEVPLAFSLANVLRAATACNFSSLIWPDGSAPAALASLLFDPPKPQIIGKTQWTATFLPFGAPASSFFWLSPSLIFSLLLFSSLTHATSAFSICPYCGKFDF